MRRIGSGKHFHDVAVTACKDDGIISEPDTRQYDVNNRGSF
jgi:hypothetical protein